MAKRVSHLYNVKGANVGGLSVIRVYPASNVVAIAEPVAGIVQEQITLLDEQNYADIFFPVGEGGYSEPWARDDHGPFRKAKLEAWLPKDNPELHECLRLLDLHRKYIALYIDNNGYTKIVGTPEYPLEFSHGLETGKRSRDPNGHDLLFTASLPTNAPFYLHQVIVPAGTRKVFSAGFSFGFRRR